VRGNDPAGGDIMAGRNTYFLMAALAATALLARPGTHDAAALDRLECIATFDPDSILVGTPAAAVSYGLSEPIGTISGVAAPDESRITVSGVDVTNSIVTLDTGGAVAGDWQLTFHGENDLKCTGTLRLKGM
jgi:hypothetical protein